MYPETPGGHLSSRDARARHPPQGCGSRQPGLVATARSVLQAAITYPHHGHRSPGPWPPHTLGPPSLEAAIGRRSSNSGQNNAQRQAARQANQGFGGPAGSHASGKAPPGSPEEQLVEKLRRIEALFARAGSEGERVAAERARERIKARLEQLAGEEPPIEFRFTLSDQWSRHLFVALMRRYGIRPYRYRGQRRTTVMARLSRSFVNETLWPEFQELQSTLAAYFDALTDRVIEQALEVKAGEAEEQQQAAPQLPPQEHQGSLL